MVEDDESIRRLLEFALESQGYQVSGFSNALEALEQMKAAPPELVLMDIKLPYRDGYYWCSRIREISAVPVVFLSSASDNMNIVIDNYLVYSSKPKVVNHVDE